MTQQQPNSLRAERFQALPIYFPGDKSKRWTRSITSTIAQLLNKYPADMFQIVAVDAFAGSFFISSFIQHLLPSSAHVITNDFQRITRERLDHIEQTEQIRQTIHQRFQRLQQHSRNGERLTTQEIQTLFSILYEAEQRGDFIDWLQLSKWFNYSRQRSINMLDFFKASHYNHFNASHPLPSIGEVNQYIQGLHIIDRNASNFNEFRYYVEHEVAQKIPEIPGLPRVFFYILDPPYYETNNDGYRDGDNEEEQAQARGPTLRTIDQLLNCSHPFMYWNTDKHDIRRIFEEQAHTLSETFETFPRVNVERKRGPIVEFLAVRI